VPECAGIMNGVSGAKVAYGAADKIDPMKRFDLRLDL